MRPVVRRDSDSWWIRTIEVDVYDNDNDVVDDDVLDLKQNVALNGVSISQNIS